MINYVENAVALPNKGVALAGDGAETEFDKLGTSTTSLYNSNEPFMDCTSPGHLI
jgi:hypothetical protein